MGSTHKQLGLPNEGHSEKNKHPFSRWMSLFFFFQNVSLFNSIIYLPFYNLYICSYTILITYFLFIIYKWLGPRTHCNDLHLGWNLNCLLPFVSLFDFHLDTVYISHVIMVVQIGYTLSDYLKRNTARMGSHSH